MCYFNRKEIAMNEPHIIDYILANTNRNNLNHLRYKMSSNYKKEFNLFYCPSCNTAFEYIKNTSTGKGKKLLKHDEFPTFKLERKVCSGCDTDIVI